MKFSQELPFSKRKQAGNKTITASEFKAMHETESVLQSQCEEYLNLHKIKYIHIPEMAYKNAYIPAGIPDLIIFKPAGTKLIEIMAGDKYCIACFVELKSKKGKVRQSQQKFARQLPVFICRSFDHFIEIINEFEELKIEGV